MVLSKTLQEVVVESKQLASGLFSRVNTAMAYGGERARTELFDYQSVVVAFDDVVSNAKSSDRDEELCLRFWYGGDQQGELMSVSRFVPSVDHLLKYDDPVGYVDSEKSSRAAVFVAEKKLKVVSRLAHVAFIRDGAARGFANELTDCLVAMGYRNKINPGDDLSSVRDRLSVLQKYVRLLAEGFDHYGVSSKNPLVVRASLDANVK